MAPPGIKVLLCERPEDCGLWFPHALSGCYTGSSIDHYCCHQIWIPATNSVRIGQSVFWFPQNIIMPTATATATATDIIIATAIYLSAALRQINKISLLPPSYTITRKALFQLNYIFSNASYAIKTQQPPTFKLPRFFTPKPIVAPQRVYPSTTQYFHNISPTTQKHGRDI